MDGQLDVHWIGQLEQKLEKSKFVRVDSNTIEHLIDKEEKTDTELSDTEKENLTESIKSLLPKIDKTEFNVTFKNLGEGTRPIQITQDEFARRMKEMSAMQPGMSFYGEMPNMMQAIVNMEHPIVKAFFDETKDKSKEESITIATANNKLKQLIDLSLLSNGLLKGEALSNFIKRSTDLL